LAARFVALLPRDLVVRFVAAFLPDFAAPVRLVADFFVALPATFFPALAVDFFAAPFFVVAFFVATFFVPAFFVAAFLPPVLLLSRAAATPAHG